VTNKFMMLLAAMYYENTNAFIDAADKTKGRTRDYLGQNLNALLAVDNEEELNLFKASKPRNIPHTPFWVITNANTGRKRIIITQMMASMGYPHYLIERIKEEI
ncbi:MAG TPA: replication initiation regulator SeqA, partial [Psychromonas sp.]